MGHNLQQKTAIVTGIVQNVLETQFQELLQANSQFDSTTNYTDQLFEKKSVDRILHIYEPLRGTPKYYGKLSVIRNKITGNADVALESYNTLMSR